MKTSNIGIILVILGILMVAYTGIDFITNERVVDIGPLKIDKEENHPLQWSPIVGVILIVGGIGLTIMGRKERI